MAHERVFFPTSNPSTTTYVAGAAEDVEQQQQQQRRRQEGSGAAAAAEMSGGGGGAAAASALLKAEIVAHPLFEHLLRAHVQCLSVGLPPEHVRALEDQLANTHGVAIKYLMLSKDRHHHHHNNNNNNNSSSTTSSSMQQHHHHHLQQQHTTTDAPPADVDVVSTSTATSTSTHPSPPLLLRSSSSSSSSSSKDIDDFMESYLQLLLVLRRHLEECAVPPSTNAMDALCELEQAFCDLTGASPSDVLSNVNPTAQLQTYPYYHVDSADVADAAAEGPAQALLLEPPSPEFLGSSSITGEPLADSFYDIDRSLFEFVRMELKQKLKDRYRESIVAIRDEIIRKRLAGKLPGDVTILKKWWNAHSKWPYPTEEEKKRMMEETGLEMRQINNWFINHRKRNWNNRASSSIGSISQQ